MWQSVPCSWSRIGKTSLAKLSTCPWYLIFLGTGRTQSGTGSQVLICPRIPWSARTVGASHKSPINQSKVYFRSNNKELQCNKCHSTWKATRKALRSLKLVAWTKNNTKNETLIRQEKRKETGGETNINMCNLSSSTNTSTYTVSVFSHLYRSLDVLTASHQDVVDRPSWRSSSFSVAFHHPCLSVLGKGTIISPLKDRGDKW